jgi:hypothetical protein
MNTSTPVRRGSPNKRPSAERSPIAVIAVAGLILLASACGGSRSSAGSGGSSHTGGSTNSQSTNSQQLAFAGCMRSSGVANFPDPNSNGQFDKTTLSQLAASNSQFQTANHACQHLLPTPSAAHQRQIAAQALAFSECMRTHGVTNFPDPDSTGRIPDPASVGIDQGSPQFEAANQACGTYRPPYMPSNAAYNAYARTQAS